MSIDFGKFKKKAKEEREIAEEEVSDIASDKVELSDNSEIISEKKSDILNGELSDNLEKSDNHVEKKSDKLDNPPKYNITSDQLRAIYVMITGKTNRGFTKNKLTNKIIEILTNTE